MELNVDMMREANLTASGKAILAFRGAEQIERYADAAEYRMLTKNSIGSRGELLDELAKIRCDGYACDNEESESGLICYAAPVRDFGGTVVAAVSISGFRDRMIAKRERLIASVRETADRISESLG